MSCIAESCTARQLMTAERAVVLEQASKWSWVVDEGRSRTGQSLRAFADTGMTPQDRATDSATSIDADADPDGDDDWTIYARLPKPKVSSLTLIGPQPTKWNGEGTGVRDLVSITSTAVDPKGDDATREVTVHVKSGVKNVLLSASATTTKDNVKGLMQDLRSQLMMQLIALHEATDREE
jgi:hypothetical protein